MSIGAGRIFLARHGETDWNAAGRLQGHTDVPLNEAGRAQAIELAERLAREGIGSVTTSDLSRARETGTIIAARLGLMEPEVDPELRERRFGLFEGLTRDEVRERYPEAWRAWLAQTDAPADAEPRADAVARISRALERVLSRTSERTGAALVISHGGAMRLWLMTLLGPDVPLVENGTVY
jgi:probable phosphoglycerate mutase